MNFSSLDNIPVVKLTLLGTPFVYLISSLSPDNPNVSFGLFNREGHPETGEMLISDLELVRGNDCTLTHPASVYPLEFLKSPYLVSEINFNAKYPLRVYYEFAKEMGAIITNESFKPNIWNKHALNMKIP